MILGIVVVRCLLSFTDGCDQVSMVLPAQRCTYWPHKMSGRYTCERCTNVSNEELQTFNCRFSCKVCFDMFIVYTWFDCFKKKSVYVKTVEDRFQLHICTVSYWVTSLCRMLCLVHHFCAGVSVHRRTSVKSRPFVFAVFVLYLRFVSN